MISHLRGKLIARNDESIVLDVSGVGLRLRVPTSALANLGAEGSEVALFTHLHVREDELSLYGFATEDELNLFELLLTVSGIGPKVAMTALSSASPDTIRVAIAQGNIDVLTEIPGIGKKTAQRLVLELKGKIDLTGLAGIEELSPLDEEVVAALLNLGYSASEARRAARAVPPSAKTVEDRVRAALRYLGGG
jgi:Holliday junction DNA helicase RuvA